MTAPRKALSRKQYLQLCIDQGGKCACGCGQRLQPMSEGVVDEHLLPRELCDHDFQSERDAMENRALYRKPCASKKTKGDVAQIAKARRQGMEAGQQHRRAKRGHGSIKSGNRWPPKGSQKISSRPFQRKTT